MRLLALIHTIIVLYIVNFAKEDFLMDSLLIWHAKELAANAKVILVN